MASDEVEIGKRMCGDEIEKSEYCLAGDGFN